VKKDENIAKNIELKALRCEGRWKHWHTYRA